MSNMRAPHDTAYAEAAKLLRAGGLVAFPTETVYGLGADATNDSAVAAIFAAKGRPSFNPLIVHVLDMEAAAREVRVDARARRIAARFWPGALSLVLPRRPECRVSLLCSAGLPSLAVRAPNHPVARSLLQAAARPIAAPSANPSGTVSPTTAAHVGQGLGDKAGLILDGGPCPLGLESSVLDLTGGTPVLLRPGGVTREDLEAEIGPISVAGKDTEIASPGMLESHYAPRLPLRLNAREAKPGEALLAFGPAPSGAAITENLSPSGDPVEAAAKLFAALHRLDRPEFTAIAVMPIPETGLGAAINDRLRRAAAPRGDS
jgi:L-threonylcarbamoyladenylate synthase